MSFRQRSEVVHLIRGPAHGDARPRPHPDGRCPAAASIVQARARADSSTGGGERA